jgi:hypothetical protein
VDPSSEYLILALPLGGLGVWTALERARLHRRSLAAEGWQLVWVRPSPGGDELHLVHERPDAGPGPGAVRQEPRWSWFSWRPADGG